MKLKKVLLLISFISIFLGFCSKAGADGPDSVNFKLYFPPAADGGRSRIFPVNNAKYDMTLNNVLNAVLNNSTRNDAEKYDFIYGGILLTGTFTLRFYGIKQDDIVVIFPKQIGQENNKWLHLTANQDQFEQNLMKIAKWTPAEQREAARLNDLRKDSLERKKPRTWRKRLYQQGTTTIQQSNANQQNTTTTIPNPPTDVSEQPLPTPW